MISIVVFYGDSAIADTSFSNIEKDCRDMALHKSTLSLVSNSPICQNLLRPSIVTSIVTLLHRPILGKADPWYVLGVTERVYTYKRICSRPPYGTNPDIVKKISCSLHFVKSPLVPRQCACHILCRYCKVTAIRYIPVANQPRS